MGDALLARWSQRPDGQHRRATIQPDGCRDLIVRARPDGRCHWFVTDLANAAYTVAGDGQDHYLGFRLQPGARVATTHLLSAVARLTPGDEAAARAALAEHTHHGASVAEALDALRHAPRVDAAARSLGICTRTLERLVRAQTDRAPAYWLQLARVRHAARLLAQPLPLAAVALDAGYADQAHLTRACRRWFGRTPGALRADPEGLAAALLSGY